MHVYTVLYNDDPVIANSTSKCLLIKIVEYFNMNTQQT